MAISRINTGTSSATTITIPTGYQIGDLMVIFAYRTGFINAPTVPSGWTTIDATQGANTNGFAIGYRIATSLSETSGTWTNSNELMCVVYRGASTTTPIGLHTRTNGTGLTVTYGAVNLLNTDASSWVVAFAGDKAVNTTIESAPTGMTNIVDFVDGSTDETVYHEQQGRSTAWSSTNVTITGTSTGWSTIVLEILSSNYYSYNASTTWTAPGNGTVTVNAWGGGGGGGADGGTGGTGGAGGGGGGFSSITSSSVTASTGYTVTVGAGGTKGVEAGAAAGVGADSWFSTSSTVLAKGGGGGTSGSGGTGGSGGASASGIGTTKFSGGAGGTAATGSSSNASGGSGGSGGFTSNGGAGGNSTTGSPGTPGAAGTAGTGSPPGAAGLIGQTSGTNGGTANTPGGGGQSGASGANGGAGGTGQVSIIFAAGVVTNSSSFFYFF